MFKVASDTAFKSNGPAFARKSGYLIALVKVEKIIRREKKLKKKGVIAQLSEIKRFFF